MNETQLREALTRGAALLAASLTTERGNDTLTLLVADRYAHFITTGEIRAVETNPNN